MRVEIYWNLHRSSYSVRALQGEDRGRVVSRPATVGVTNVTFAVQPAGRARVLADRRKNVHAFVRGEAVPVGGLGGWNEGVYVRVSYNPYRGPTFYEVGSGRPVSQADRVICTTTDNGKAIMFALNPR